MHITTAFVFAAGLGKRLALISGDTPKPLVKFNEKPLIDWAIDNFINHGIEHIVINLYYKSELIKQHLEKYKNFDISISEEPQLFETGGALIYAMHLINKGNYFENSRDISHKYIFTSNSDVIWNDSNVLLILEKTFIKLINQGKIVDIVMVFSKRMNKAVTAFDVADNNEVIIGDNLPYMFCGIQIINLELILKYSKIHDNKKIFSLGEIYIASKAQNGKLNNVYGVLCDDVYHVGTEEEFLFLKNLNVLR